MRAKTLGPNDDLLRKPGNFARTSLDPTTGLSSPVLSFVIHFSDLYIVAERVCCTTRDITFVTLADLSDSLEVRRTAE